MPATDPTHWISELFNLKGDLQYGENVSQRQHALQCGLLASEAGASPSLVLAAVLHDVGHMLHQDAATALAQGHDDVHEALGAKTLARWFPASVTEPIRLHVQAKRYLCAREPSYWTNLSDLSKQTLTMQGGPMQPSEMKVFESLEHAPAAVQLRRWDDAAKEADQRTPDLQAFLKLIPALAA